MKLDRRTRHYKRSHTTWCAILALALLAGGIFISSISVAPRKSESIQQTEVFIPKVSRDLTKEELDKLNCEINKSLCPVATPKPSKWKYLDFKHTQHYQEVIEGLQARFTNWQPVAEIIARESGFQPHAKNKNSTAYGLGQLIKSNQKVDCGVDIDCQLDLTKTYIINRYGSPSKALSFHDKNNWY